MEYIEVMGHLKKLSLHMMDNRYFGPSSNLAFMRKAFSMKSEQTGQEVNVKKDHWKKLADSSRKRLPVISLYR